MRDFVRESSKPFNGFAGFLNRKNKVSDFISASGEKESQVWGPASTVLDHSDCTNTSCQWASPGISDKQKSFITFEFSCPTLITHYTLQTRTDYSDNLPVSWKVEASLNKINWYTIDQKENRNELKSKSAHYRYKCDNSDNNLVYAKYLRIWLTKSSSQKYHFHLSKVDFFGRMNIDKCIFPFSVAIPPYTKCNNNHHTHSASLFLLFLVN